MTHIKLMYHRHVPLKFITEETRNKNQTIHAVVTAVIQTFNPQEF